MSALLTASELAEELHIHRETVYRLTKQNLLPCVRLGWIYRYDLEDVLRHLAQRDTRLAQSLQAARAAESQPSTASLL